MDKKGEGKRKSVLKESSEGCESGGEGVKRDRELKRMPLRKSDRKPRKASRLIEEDEGEG